MTGITLWGWGNSFVNFADLKVPWKNEKVSCNQNLNFETLKNMLTTIRSNKKQAVLLTNFTLDTTGDKRQTKQEQTRSNKFNFSTKDDW